MAKRFVIRDMAEKRNLTETQLLQTTLDKCGHEQKRVAAALGVSQATVSEALKRNRFVRRQLYIQEQAS